MVLESWHKALNRPAWTLCTFGSIILVRNCHLLCLMLITAKYLGCLPSGEISLHPKSRVFQGKRIKSQNKDLRFYKIPELGTHSKNCKCMAILLHNFSPFLAILFPFLLQWENIKEREESSEQRKVWVFLFVYFVSYVCFFWRGGTDWRKHAKFDNIFIIIINKCKFSLRNFSVVSSALTEDAFNALIKIINKDVT